MSSDTPSSPPDFDVHAASIRTRMAKAGNIALWVLLAGPIWPIWDTALGLLIAFAITRPARAGGGVLRGTLLLGMFFVFLVVCGILFQTKIAKTSWFSSLMVGRQRFLPLGGPPRKLFNFILRCDSTLDLILRPEDASILSQFGNLEFAGVERGYKSEYQKLNFDPGNWPETWHTIAQTGTGNATYGATVKSGHWTMLWLKVASANKLVTPLTMLYLAVSLWLLTTVASGGQLLTLLQFVLGAGFLIAVTLFANFTYSFGEINILNIDNILSTLGIPRPQAIRTDLADESPGAEELKKVTELQAAYEGKQIFAEVVTRDGYIESIRNYFSRLFLINGLANALLFGLLIILQIPFALLWSSWPDSRIFSWATRMAIGVALLPLVLLVVLSLSFLILANLKRFGILLVSGVTLAIIPPLITYALNGSIGTARTSVIISSIITGVIGCIGSAVADVVNEHTRGARS